MKIELIPAFTKIPSKAKHFDILARMTAPALKKKSKRPSLNLGLALDQSGSMSTGDAFGQAKQAALSLLSQLEPTDRISVVLYNGVARVILPSCPVTEARIRLPDLLANEQAGGSTALHAGWLTAAQQVAPYANEYGISRVLLLSDGQATDGKRDPAELKEESHQLLAAGISTGTYGLGMYFNELLMTELAAGGPARFAQDADQLAPYFMADFSLLSQTVAPKVELHVDATDGDGKSIDVDILNGYTRGGDGYWRLPAAVAGAETWAALRLDLSGVQSNKKICVKASWKWVDTKGSEHQAEETINISSGKGKPNEVASERCAEAMAAKMAKEAAAAARMGDFAAAGHTIGLMRGLSASNAYINSVSDNLDRLVAAGDATSLAKEALYSSTTMSSRVAEAGECASFLDADRFGLRKAVQGKHDEANKDKSEDRHHD